MERKEFDHEILRYRVVVRSGPTKPACMKALSKRVWRLPGSSASRSAPSTHQQSDVVV